jgi:hypothetical protein
MTTGRINQVAIPLPYFSWGQVPAGAESLFSPWLCSPHLSPFHIVGLHTSSGSQNPPTCTPQSQLTHHHRGPERVPHHPFAPPSHSCFRVRFHLKDLGSALIRLHPWLPSDPQPVPPSISRWLPPLLTLSSSSYYYILYSCDPESLAIPYTPKTPLFPWRLTNPSPTPRHFGSSGHLALALLSGNASGVCPSKRRAYDV